MRQERVIQASIFDIFARHDMGRELQAMSQWLDEHHELLSLVASDLLRQGLRDTGRQGLPAEAVLRCALLKQHRQLSYEELAFHLEDSATFRAFARLPLSACPKKSVLHKTVSAIRAETWERINRALLHSAKQEKVESGTVVRLDSTVCKALMHEPSDSSLLWDSVRVMVRLLEQASALPGGEAIPWRNHRRLAKKRALAIQHARGKASKTKLYRELIAATEATVTSLRGCQAAAPRHRGRALARRGRALLALDRARHRPEQAACSRRRSGAGCREGGQPVRAACRHHRQGGRDVQYGHKLNLTTGKSGLILDVVVEAGNPADAERFLPMLERHVELYGAAPRQTATDGGYASRDNLTKGKAMGVSDVAFHKKRGLAIEDMVKSRWVYRKLRNFRAGIEAGISCLKRAYGLARCTWRGLSHFKAYVWASVVAYNVALFSGLRST
jgi:IS5 family transposase